MKLQASAPTQNYDLSLSGGTETAKFFAGVGVNMQDGIVMYTNANRFSARFNSEFSFLDGRIKLGENITMAYRTSHGVSNLDEGSPIQQALYRSQTIIPVIWDDGPYQGVTHFWENGDWGGTGIAPRLGQAGNQVASLTR